MDDKKITTINTYDKFCENYITKIGSLTNYNDTYEDLARYASDNAKILDLACGPATISQFIKKDNPSAQITGVDLSSNMLHQAKKNIPDGRFIKDDLLTFSFDGECFDIVILGFGLPYISLTDFKTVISRINSVIKPGGKLYLSFMEGNSSGYESTSFSGESKVYIYYHPKSDIQTLLTDNDFTIIHDYVLGYKESDGSITNDIIYIAEKSNGGA